MEINPADAGVRFAESVIGDDEITGALNALQRAYEEYMGPAWTGGGDLDEEKGKRIATRGIAFLIAAGAFHFVHTADAPPHIVKFLSEAIGDVAVQMADQLKKHRAAAAAARRRTGKA